MNENNIYLKPIDEKDTDLIIKWRNNSKVRKNFIFQGKLTKEIHEKWLKDKVFTGNVVQFIIMEKKTNRPLGSIYLRDIDKINMKAELGIFIGEDNARGKGYGKEAIVELLKYGFTKLKLNKIYLRVLKDNVVAISSYNKSGFSQEGLFKQDVVINGQYYDIAFMAIFKSDWRKINLMTY